MALLSIKAKQPKALFRQHSHRPASQDELSHIEDVYHAFIFSTTFARSVYK